MRRLKGKTDRADRASRGLIGLIGLVLEDSLNPFTIINNGLI